MATFWVLIKMLFWGCTLLFLAFATFFSLHPLWIQAKTRLTPQGQRMEVWFTHLFGLIGVGGIATRRDQKVVLRIGRFHFILRQWGRKKPKSKSVPPKPPPSLEKVESSDSTHFGNADGTSPPTPILGPSQSGRAAGDECGRPSPSEFTSSGEGGACNEGVPPFIEKTPEKPLLTSSEPDEEDFGSPASSISSFSSKNKDPNSSEGDLKDGAQKKESSSAQKSEDGFWKRFHSFRKTLGQKLRIVKRTILKALAIWARISPMCKRLTINLWRSFFLSGPKIRVQYGLAEPHLTGMMQGMLIQTSGFLWPLGIELLPVPVFLGHSIHLRGEVAVKILPWRVLYSGLRLSVEKEVWLGSRDLWIWYRSQKNLKK